jgi:Tfp pilus assembly pilus retraction ATPase PilT
MFEQESSNDDCFEKESSHDFAWSVKTVALIRKCTYNIHRIVEIVLRLLSSFYNHLKRTTRSSAQGSHTWDTQIAMWCRTVLQ